MISQGQSLDFQGPTPFPLALVIDLPASKGLRTGAVKIIPVTNNLSCRMIRARRNTHLTSCTFPFLGETVLKFYILAGILLYFIYNRTVKMENDVVKAEARTLLILF